MSIQPLVDLVHKRRDAEKWDDANRAVLTSLFGSAAGRYPAAAANAVKLRAPALSGDDGVPFAAYIHPANPDSGAYGGMSIAIFPVPDAPALITFVVGTTGLSPDEEILGRPGHGRKLKAICRWLNSKHGGGNVVAWAKSDPVRIDQSVPSNVIAQFQPYKKAFDRYGNVLYAIFAPTADEAATRDALVAFLDLMFEERGYAPLASVTDGDAIRGEWLTHLMPDASSDDAARLLERRRFVVLQGPPGTGKTRMALETLRQHYAGNGMTVQFHPNTTYENFVGGLAPVQTSGGMGFQFAPLAGYLMRAATAARAVVPQRYLLHLDEINRADLSKVLGEAIYLLEPEADRGAITLPHDFGEPFGDQFAIPDNLDIIGTMNTADRSLAIVDVAVRRRFAFLALWPQMAVVQRLGGAVMQQAFQGLMDIFVEHASDDAFDLMPGHSYFLEGDDARAPERLRVTLAPLLEEYLAQGYVAGFSEPIRSYLQYIESL